MSCRKIAVLIAIFAAYLTLCQAAPAEPEVKPINDLKPAGSEAGDLKPADSETDDLKPAASGYWGSYGPSYFGPSYPYWGGYSSYYSYPYYGYGGYGGYGYGLGSGLYGGRYWW